MTRSPKFFIFIGMLLMLVALAFTYVVWIKIQSVVDMPEYDLREKVEQLVAPEENAESTVDAEEQEVEVDDIENPVKTEVKEPAANTYRDIKASDLPLSETQKSMAENFGLDIDTLVITVAMQKCAEDKLGSDRYQKILGGSIPGVTESLKLFGCLK